MFLWVRLGPRLDPGANKKQLRTVVSAAPSGLEQIFQRDLQVILNLEETERLRAIEILRWIFFAVRPLTVRELTEALIANTNSTLVYLFDEIPDSWDEHHVNHQIRRLSLSSVDIRSNSPSHPVETQTVHFVHSSVKEFLSKPLNGRFDWNVSFQHAAREHNLLAKTCLSYICYDDIVKGHDFTAEHLEQKIRLFQFLPYAAQMSI
jgi:hypothetical protein